MTAHEAGRREAGKGDAPRKQQDQKAYEEGWDRIFKPKPKENPIKDEPLTREDND